MEHTSHIITEYGSYKSNDYRTWNIQVKQLQNMEHTSQMITEYGTYKLYSYRIWNIQAK